MPIDNISISDQVRQIKAHSLEEIRKITNNPKFIAQVEAILNRGTYNLEEHFQMIQATISNSKEFSLMFRKIVNTKNYRNSNGEITRRKT